MKTFLIVAAGNSLSHVGKALSLRSVLIRKNHTAIVAAGQNFSGIFSWLKIPFAVISDIQERDHSSFPTITWFSDTAIVRNCVLEEIALIERIQPDAVIGIFRFTLKAAAHMVGIPYYSLSCGCLLPDTNEPLGLFSDEAGNKKQQVNIDYFFRYAGSRIGRALNDSGLTKKITDAREMLLGDKTFLWDFPEFMPAREKAGRIHCGPLEWSDWPYDKIDYSSILPATKPLAIISFGTCNFSDYVLNRLSKNLLALGYSVIVSTGGQGESSKQINDHPDLRVLNMLPLKKLLPHASLLISHGGQLTIFAALQAKIPTLVMPFHPEQAHNASCLERIGCGRQLIDATFFYGKSEVYLAALEKMPDTQIRKRIRSLTEQTELSRNLSIYSNILNGYTGAETVADILVNEMK